MSREPDGHTLSHSVTHGARSAPSTGHACSPLLGARYFYFGLSLEEWVAGDDGGDEGGELVVAGLGPGDHAFHGALVVALEAATEGVDGHFLGDVAEEFVAVENLL